MEQCIQIDVKKVVDSFTPTGNQVICNMQTGGRDVQIMMKQSDYAALVLDGFFIRDGRTRDSAGVLNTTLVYEPKQNNG